MLVKVWGYRVSTVFTGWFGLLLSAIIILPCVLALQFSDVITRKITNIPNANCRLGYEDVLADLTAAFKLAVMGALVNLLLCICLIMEIEKYIFPANTDATRKYRIVWIYCIPYKRPAVSKSDNKSGSKPKIEEV